MADPTAADAAFDPSTVEANRAVEQGLGVGGKEPAAQRDRTPKTAPDPLGDDDLGNE